MKRFAIAAALAAAIGLGTAGTADAQLVVTSGRVTPYGVVTQRQFYNPVYNPGAYQTLNTYSGPFGMYRQRYNYADPWGNYYRASGGYNPLSGYGYQRGYYQTSPYLYPSGGYYGFYGRRW